MGRLYGSLFGSASIAVALLALYKGENWLLMLYPALSLAVVSVAYLCNEPKLFGKRSDGTIGVPSLIALLPYLALAISFWHLTRLSSREEKCDQVNEDLILARRLLGAELPDGVSSIVDLTCEFVEPRAVRQHPGYTSLPMLDGMGPDGSDLHAMAVAASELPKPILIHCAQGHGRTGLLAAAILLVTGQARSAEDAVSTLQVVRPRVALNSTQRCLLSEVPPRSPSEA